MRTLYLFGVALGLIGYVQNEVRALAHQSGEMNVTLEPTDPRILYEPLYRLFAPVKTPLGMDFIRASDAGGFWGVKRAASVTLSGGMDGVSGF